MNKRVAGNRMEKRNNEKGKEGLGEEGNEGRKVVFARWDGGSERKEEGMKGGERMGLVTA